RAPSGSRGDSGRARPTASARPSEAPPGARRSPDAPSSEDASGSWVRAYRGLPMSVKKTTAIGWRATGPRSTRAADEGVDADRRDRRGGGLHEGPTARRVGGRAAPRHARVGRTRGPGPVRDDAERTDRLLREPARRVRARRALRRRSRGRAGGGALASPRAGTLSCGRGLSERLY